MKRRISVILGTRPEAIKLCPVIRQLRENPLLEAHVCATGQHRQMLDQVLDIFGITPEADLDLMQPNQTLAGLTARAINGIDRYFEESKPSMVVVQGDTTTAFCGALAAFYRKIPVAHVEAGLRTWNKFAPFPEEMNRVLVSRLTDLHFAPTSVSAANLFAEGVPKERVVVTGNTVIDALHFAVAKNAQHPPAIPELPEQVLQNDRLVLITGHRRENFGAGFESLCEAIRLLATKYPQAAFIYPVHLNPNVREPVYRILSACRNVHLLPPLDYLPFVRLMKACHIVLSDSGGVQEEAPSLGKPVLVMRDTTERPEALEAGTVRLVGTDCNRIVDNVSELFDSPAAYGQMSNRANPYGDGHASQRIVQAIASAS